MDLSRGNEKTIGVFVFGSETKKLVGWIPKETISSEVERMDQMELKISLIQGSQEAPTSDEKRRLLRLETSATFCLN